MKKIWAPILLMMMTPTLAAAPKSVVIQSPPSSDVVQLEGFCTSPCYSDWADISWFNETTDKVLVVTDLIFANEGAGTDRLRVSVTVWNPPYDYDNDATEARVSHMLLYVPPNDTRALNLQTGIRVEPGQWLAIPLFEGAGHGVVTVLGRLEAQ